MKARLKGNFLNFQYENYLTSVADTCDPHLRTGGEFEYLEEGYGITGASFTGGVRGARRSILSDRSVEARQSDCFCVRR